MKVVMTCGMAGTDGTDIQAEDVVECTDAVGQRFIEFNIARPFEASDSNRPLKRYFPQPAAGVAETTEPESDSEPKAAKPTKKK